MKNREKSLMSHKKIIIIIAAIAAATAVCLLFVFKPWEHSAAEAVTYQDAEEYSGELSALANPDDHIGEEISFTAEAIGDSANYEGMLVVSAVADNQYVVIINFLDQERQLSFNTGDKMNVTGFITGISLIETEEGNPLSGVEIAAQTLEFVY